MIDTASCIASIPPPSWGVRFEKRREENAIGTSSGDSAFVLSCLNLKRTAGVLGVLLFVILGIGDLVLGSSTGVQESISDYYGTTMRGILVGVLLGIGVFMFSYDTSGRFRVVRLAEHVGTAV